MTEPGRVPLPDWIAALAASRPFGAGDRRGTANLIDASDSIRGPRAASIRIGAGTGGSASSRASRYAVIFAYGRAYGTPRALSTSGAWLFPSPSRNRGPNRASRLARQRATSAGSCIHIFSTPVANGTRRVAASKCPTAPRTSPPASGMKMAWYPRSSSSAAAAARAPGSGLYRSSRLQIPILPRSTVMSVAPLCRGRDRGGTGRDPGSSRSPPLTGVGARQDRDG